jgi:hypothetical protein
MTDEQYKQLAQLVTYLLESEDWKTVWLNEYAEPIKLFMIKTRYFVSQNKEIRPQSIVEVIRRKI